jgi:hypothetical protein
MDAEINNFLLKAVGVIVITGIGLILTEILRNLVKNYFETTKNKKTTWNNLVQEVRELVIQVRIIVERLEEHKEYDEEFRATLERQIGSKNKYILNKIDENSAISQNQFLNLENKNTLQAKEIGELKEKIKNLELIHKYCKNNTECGKN